MKTLPKIVGSLCMAATLVCCETKGESVDPALLEEGVSIQLATLRKAQLEDVHYDLSFDIPAEKEDSITAELHLDFSLKQLRDPLILDFKEEPESLLFLKVNGTKIPVQWEKEHIRIPASGLQEGSNRIYIRFIAGELSLNRNDDYLYTLLVPDRARTLFPCFDQPDIKATYTLKITVPDTWEVLCGAPLREEVPQGSRTVYQFQPSDTMSTYLFSFVAGEFKSAGNDNSETPMKMLFRETNPDKIKLSSDTIFDLHAHAREYLEAYTNIPYPFQKLDFAAIPGFQYGGMEHVGAIQYREQSLFLDQTATQSQELNRAKLIAHETAHMWFGDLVTMKWFNDVWLKEVFANLMADKIINPAFPEVNHPLQFMLDHHPSAYSVDRTRGSNAIRQELNNLADAGSLYGTIIYHKAPIVLRQLERILGEDSFKQGLRQYLHRFANDNADWGDLVGIFDSLSPLDIKQWSEIWINSAGRPIISTRVRYHGDKTINSLDISQSAEDGSVKLWPQVFNVGLIYADTLVNLPVNLLERQATVPGAAGRPKPMAVLYNSDGNGYGIFPIDEDVTALLPELKDAVARGNGYINVFENTLSGRMSVEKALSVFSTALASEPNELILQYLSGVTDKLFWSYLDESQRHTFRESLEKILFNRMRSHVAASLKKTLFGLFSSLAYSDWGKGQLYQIWSGELKIEGLKLNEDDYTRMAMLLAVFEHPEAKAILEKAREAISNPDQLRRFDFLRPALSADEAERAAFFQSFREATNREKESWVITACYYIHHPLRQKTAIRYLPMSLEILPEIAATGDIFFPKAWLDNTIGSYQSAGAYQILNDYLDTTGNLSPFLKAKILQATDDLYRLQQSKQYP